VGNGPLGPMIDRYPGLRLASLGIPWGLLRGTPRAPRPEPPKGVRAEQLHGIVPISDDLVCGLCGAEGVRPAGDEALLLVSCEFE